MHYSTGVKPEIASNITSKYQMDFFYLMDYLLMNWPDCNRPCSGVLLCGPQWAEESCDPVAADWGRSRRLVCQGIQLLWHPAEILQGELLFSAQFYFSTLPNIPVLYGTVDHTHWQHTENFSVCTLQGPSTSQNPQSCLRLSDCSIVHVTGFSAMSAADL